MDRYCQHTWFSDPGSYAVALSALPADVTALMQLIRQLVTLPEEMRRPNHICKTQQLRQYRRFINTETVLASLLNGSQQLHPLSRDARLPLPAEQQALLLCSLLRQSQIRARMRAGFALQDDGELWRGHWICEWQDKDRERWHGCDLQLSQVEVTDQQFITGSQAWSKRKDMNCNLFRHDRLKGLSAVKRFLLNDFHCLAGHEMVHYQWSHSGGGKGPPLFYRSASSLTRAQWQQLEHIAEICSRADDRPSRLRSEFDNYIADAEPLTSDPH